MLPLKGISLFSEWRITYSKERDHIMRQVVAYQRLTLQVPIVTNINFLLTISICCQEK